MTAKPQPWGLLLTDAGLVSQGVLTPTEKIVLAAILAPRARNDSVEQLRSRLPFGTHTIEKARAALQRKGVITLSKPQGQYRLRSVTAVHPTFDTRLGPWIAVPQNATAAVKASSPRGGENVLLLLMLYTRQQLRRGAVHVRDTAACNDLGLTMTTLKMAKRKLRDAGLLEQIDTQRGTPVYRLPHEAFDPERLPTYERTLTETSMRDAPITEHRPSLAAFEPIPF